MWGAGGGESFVCHTVKGTLQVLLPGRGARGTRELDAGGVMTFLEISHLLGRLTSKGTVLYYLDMAGHGWALGEGRGVGAVKGHSN